MEIEHLKAAAELMRKLENRDPEEILPAALERPMKFQENKAYVRKVLETQINLTAKETDFVPIESLGKDDRYFDYQHKVNDAWSPTEEIIKETVKGRGEEYRLETEGQHPVPGLRREKERNGERTAYAERVAA